jgi:hypothetical protein
MGSAAALAVGLLLTFVVFLFLPEHAERLEPERKPLAEAIVIFTIIALGAAASFYGDLRRTPWRPAAHAVLVAMLAVAVWVYWPR